MGGITVSSLLPPLADQRTTAPCCSLSGHPALTWQQAKFPVKLRQEEDDGVVLFFQPQHDEGKEIGLLFQTNFSTRLITDNSSVYFLKT